MLVRLAFSVMMEADADILLIDEVLAVGDAAFQQKCADAFREMKAAGKTIVLVTHEMRTVEEYCHRAMLVDGGQIQLHRRPRRGRPPLPAAELRDRTARPDPRPRRQSSEEVRLLDAWIEDADGARLDQPRARAASCGCGSSWRSSRDTPGLEVGFIIANADGIGVFQFGTAVRNGSGGRELAAGERVRSAPRSRTCWSRAATSCTAASTGPRTPASPSTSHELPRLRRLRRRDPGARHRLRCRSRSRRSWPTGAGG